MASAHPSMSQSLRMSSTLSGSPFTIEAHADRLIIIRDGGSSRTFSHQRQTSTSSTGSSTSGSRHRHSQSRHHRQSSESGGKSVLAIAYGDGTAVPIPVGVPLSTAEVPQPTAPSTSTAPFADSSGEYPTASHSPVPAITLEQLNAHLTPPGKEGKQGVGVDAILGCITLSWGTYLIVAWGHSVGRLQHRRPVFQVRKTMALSLATYEAAADGIEQLRHYVEHRPEHGESMDEQLAVATASQSCLNERSSSSSASSSSEDVRAPQLNESSTVTVQEAHIETTVDPLAMPRGRDRPMSSMRDSLVISDMSVNLRPSSPPLVEEIYSISRAMTPFHLGDVASKLPSPMASTLFEKPASMKDRRILAELMSILSNGTVYYAHDVDLTNSHQRSVNYDGAAFRFGQLDERFWWNRHLLRPFVKALKPGAVEEWTAHAIQGRVQIHACVIDDHHFDFALVSRRSCKRAGYRYQRRGLDSAGDVANFVETEQVVFFEDGEGPHVLSFVQTRGSIPLFWSQSPQRRKPMPVLERSHTENLAALRTHFNAQKSKYGRQVIVSLVEQTGREAIVGSAYRQYVEELSDEQVKFVDFDIHQECRGMRYEHISRLIAELEHELAAIGYFWSGPKGLLTLQNGAVRTNCMDCLDRTNVVQCSIARNVINLQLLRLGIHSYPEKGLQFYVDFEELFNHVWANNGDAVSMAYTNTVALKGDVTRTGRRNVKGVINDGAASLMRLYHNNFRDGFRQTVVDLILGNISVEAALGQGSAEGATDAHNEDDVLKEQQDAIEATKQIVLTALDAKTAQAWICLSIEPTVKKLKGVVAVEKILLLTADAYFVCVYDYVLEKATQYKRVPLRNIIKIQKGTLFLDKSETNVESNYGFIISYKATAGEETRMTGAALNSGDYVRHLTQDRGPRQQEATDIFKLASSSSDTSQSLVDQLIARLVTAYLQVELTDADVTPRKNFVSDAPIRLERGLLGRFGEMLRTKSKELPVARRRASEAAPDRL